GSSRRNPKTALRHVSIRWRRADTHLDPPPPRPPRGRGGTPGGRCGAPLLAHPVPPLRVAHERALRARTSPHPFRVARLPRPLGRGPLPPRRVPAEQAGGALRIAPSAQTRRQPRRGQSRGDTARRPARRTAAVQRRQPAVRPDAGRSAARRSHRGARRSRRPTMTAVEPVQGPRLKRLVVGSPRATGQLEETLLPKRLALPIFASDALSSVAYATEAALVVLLAASATGRQQLLPVSGAIALLLAIVIISYQQTVRVYESSGGAYVVAKDNLGTLPSLVGAAALLTDYVLTVAVSVAAGVVALVSAVPSLGAHRLSLSLTFIALITIANLRGVRESGLAFAIPTYAFIASMLALVLVGGARCSAGECGPAVAPQPMTIGVGAIGLFVLLRAFASGSTALTGVEAIANGVSAFRRPQSRNAARTLGILGVLAITFFIGVSYLTIEMHAVPNEGGYPSLVSQIARVVFPAGSPSSFMYYAVQASTVAILVLAANTAYQGFPRLAALLARDRFFPRQFTNLGDRLVFSNGIVVLAAVAAGLIWIYDADVEALIHLYVIGV